MRRIHVILAACCTAAGISPSWSTPRVRAPEQRVEAPPRLAIVASVAGQIASDRPVRARKGDRVTLHAVVVVGTQRPRVYADVETLVLDGKPLRAQPLSRAPIRDLRWHRLEPALASYSNGNGPTFHYEPIEYRATPISGTENHGAIVADVRPTLTPIHEDGVGTMRYQIVGEHDGRSVASPGPDARRSGASGGLVDAVLRVSIRRDDTFLGYLTEMYGQPYIWASAGRSDATHQSERLEGSDCADFVIYGRRRMGQPLAYSWTGALPQVTTSMSRPGTRGSDGVYRDARGAALPFTAVGDIVLFPRHVGVLTGDRGQPGVLDDRDVMMHTLFDSPKEQPIGETSYADTTVEIRRFRDAR